MFEAIAGQDRLKALLSGAMMKNQISHAYLFVGAPGTGKTAFAWAFAQAILCTEENPAKRPCGHCSSCAHFASDSHPDFVRVAPEEGARTIKIAQIRRVLTIAATRPFEGGNRVFLIEHGELMTAEAQNALLKSLEEPEPGNVFLILTDNVSKVLPTIRSRCQVLTLEPPAEAPVTADDDETLNQAAAGVLCDILKGKLMPIFDFAKKAAAAAGGGIHVCEHLIAVIAETLEAQAGVRDTATAKKIADLADAGTLIRAQEILFELTKRLNTNANSRLQWEAALLEISELN